jgi:hypothetical protein
VHLGKNMNGHGVEIDMVKLGVHVDTHVFRGN